MLYRCRKCGKTFKTHHAQMQHSRDAHNSRREEELHKHALEEMHDMDYAMLYWHDLEDAGDR